MKTWQRVLAYGAALVVVFGVAVGIGTLVGPISADDDEHGHGADAIHLDPAEGEGGHEHGAEDTPEATAEDAAGGFYELALEHDVLDSGRPQVAFRILDEVGEPVTSYDRQHERRLHLIAVRRDLAEFRHVHPRLDVSTGRWTVPIRLEGGAWRVYADFAPTGGEPTVAEADLMVAGEFAPEELGPDTATARVDGYEVHLERDEATSMVTLHVTRDGAEVTDLQPYLGAYGHLVAIRANDLAYLHVHPEEGEPGPEVAFHAAFDETGRYRLFLDFKHRGRVHTADFTISADPAGHPEEHGDEPAEEDSGHDH